MKNKEHENLNPEDYWKDAEKLLDQHFKAKRKRRVLALLLLLFIPAVGLYTFKNYHGGSGQQSNAALTRSALKPASNDHIQDIKQAGETLAGHETVASEIRKVSENKTAREEITASTTALRDETAAKKQVTASGTKNQSEAAAIALNIKTEKSDDAEITNDEHASSPGLSATAMEQQQVENKPDPFLLMPLLPFSGINHDVNPEINFSALPVSNTKIKARWDLLIYAGGALVDGKVKDQDNATYTDRMNSEEHHAILPDVGFQFSRSTGNWDLRAGFELAVLGEKTNYSPYSNGEYYNIYQDWQHYQYTISDTDSTYISGILFIQQKSVIINDSMLVDVSDTLNGSHYNAAILNANGVNKHYIVEIPLDVTYQLSRGRFGVGISAGVSPGMVVTSKGNYLVSDESGTSSLKNESSQFTLNARAGIELSYLLTERMRFVLRPTGKFYLTGIKEKYGATHHYNSYGVNVGILYHIH